MKFNLKITEPVLKNENPKNLIHMHINNMHGDADHYSKNILKFDPTNATHLDLLNNILSIYHIYKSYDPYTFMSSESKRFSILHENGITDNDMIDRVLDHVFEPDITNDGSSWAIVESIELTYFDSNGVEYHMIAISENDHAN